MKTLALAAVAAVIAVDPAAAGTLAEQVAAFHAAGASAEADAEIAVCLIEWLAPLLAVPATFGALLHSVRI